eukprot:gnl/TRDRNA2_/TRDRNA2_74831_c0_seq1.p1 gnl/TRDRNA2_/TRDRNA2_74831_c0~~gnl/TRDRNA2_/TRDRNA2_74831_c0_seq1.p1  ORF type:complete len:378 (-),score=39.02 gnl/TRDRNA2_/TRDRNA2_74831_c0_seq1:68-1201(-)
MSSSTKARQRHHRGAPSDRTNGSERLLVESHSHRPRVVSLILCLSFVSSLAYLFWWRSSAAKHADLQKLFSWVEQHTGDNALSGIRVQDVDKNGIRVRGLVATKDFSMGSEVWRVHPSVVVMELHESFVESGLETMVQGTLGSDVPVHLTLFLAIEGCKARSGLPTFWQHLIQVWPTPEELATFSPYYASEELLDLFSELPAVHRLRADLNHVQTAWSTQSSHWRKLAQRFGIDKIEFNDFLWAYVIILSRAFVVRKSPVIVSVTDLANTDQYLSGNVEQVFENHGQDSFIVYKAKRDIARGTEITISYGNRTNDVLFQGWGFLLPENPNKILPHNQASKSECAALRTREWPSAHAQISILNNLKALVHEYCLGADP